MLGVEGFGRLIVDEGGHDSWYSLAPNSVGFRVPGLGLRVQGIFFLHLVHERDHRIRGWSSPRQVKV